MAERLDEEVETNARLLRQMDEMLGLARRSHSSGCTANCEATGFRRSPCNSSREKRGVGAVVHYRDWYDLLVDAGARVAGKDPVATFLTQVARAPGVESVRPRSGLYRLKAV